MKIVIKTTNIKLTNVLREFIEEKINSLEKFSKNFYTEKYQYLVENSLQGKGKPRIEAWVEIGKTTLHHQKGPWFYVECQMHFPKKSLRATAKRENLKLAIVEVKDELQRELKKYKEKLTSQTKKGVRALKNDLRLTTYN